MTDIDDQVGRLDRPMDKVAGRQRGIAKTQRVALIEDALSHLGRHERDAELFHERPEDTTRTLAVGAGPHDKQRASRTPEALNGRGDRLLFCRGSPHDTRGR